MNIISVRPSKRMAIEEEVTNLKKEEQEANKHFNNIYSKIEPKNKNKSYFNSLTFHQSLFGQKLQGYLDVLPLFQAQHFLSTDWPSIMCNHFLVLVEPSMPRLKLHRLFFPYYYPLVLPNHRFHNKFI